MRIYAADFEFAFYTGMRPSEIAALRWEEVDKEKRLVNVCRIVANYKIEKRTKTGTYVRSCSIAARCTPSSKPSWKHSNAPGRAAANAPICPACSR